MLLGFTHDMFSTQQAENEVLGLCSGSFTDSQQIQTSQQHSQERNQESSQEGWVLLIVMVQEGACGSFIVGAG